MCALVRKCKSGRVLRGRGVRPPPPPTRPFLSPKPARAHMHARPRIPPPPLPSSPLRARACAGGGVHARGHSRAPAQPVSSSARASSCPLGWECLRACVRACVRACARKQRNFWRCSATSSARPTSLISSITSSGRNSGKVMLGQDAQRGILEHHPKSSVVVHWLVSELSCPAHPQRPRV